MDLTLSPAEKDAVITRWKGQSFTNTHEDVNLLKALILHTIPSFNYQECLFLYVCRMCKSMPRSNKQYKVADVIYAQFIPVDSPMQINLSNDHRTNVDRASQQQATVVVGGRQRPVTVDVRTGRTFDVVLVEVQNVIKGNFRNTVMTWLEQGRTVTSKLSTLSSADAPKVSACLTKLAGMGLPIL
jgi:hypothetical protein